MASKKRAATPAQVEVTAEAVKRMEAVRKERADKFEAWGKTMLGQLCEPVPRPPPPPLRTFWCVLDDACGLVCALLTHFVVQFVNYVTVTRVLYPWLYEDRKYYRLGLLQTIMFEVVIVLIVWSHLKCMLSDPGTLPRRWSTEDRQAIKSEVDRRVAIIRRDGRKVAKPWCYKCDNFKPVHTHHCSYCGCCVELMDHHCPWMNNCVARNNHKFFMQFLFYVGLGSGYAIVAAVVRLLRCYSKPKRFAVAAMNCTMHESGATLVLFIVSIVFSLLFLLFVSCMGCEQLEEIGDETTMVEKKKGMRPERVGVWRGLTRKFGEPFSWRWFLPVHAYELRDTLPPLAHLPQHYGWFTIFLTGTFFALGAYWLDVFTAYVLFNWKR